MIIPMVSVCGEHNTIMVLNTTGNPPLNNEQMDGFMDLVAAEALSRIGIKLKTVALPAERGLLNSNKHIIDGELSRVAGMQRLYPNLVQVPEKIMDWEFVAIGKSGLNTKNGWQSVAGKSVGLIHGWKILEENIAPIANIKKVKDANSLFRLLQNQRVEYIIYERWAGAKYINDLGLTNVSNNIPALAKREMYIYLHKKHAEHVNKLAAALRSMKSDGTYERIKTDILKKYN